MKLPHWLLLAFGVITILGPDVAKVVGLFDPGAAAPVAHVMGEVIMLIALWTNPPGSASSTRSTIKPPPLLAWIGGALVVTFLACLFALLTTSCTAAQQAMALTAEQDLCAFGELTTSVIPIGTDPATVAADIKLGCGLAETATGYVDQLVTAWEAQNAPAPAGAVYSPGVKARALRHYLPTASLAVFPPAVQK